jgi:putative MATE family efflux protein
MVGAFTNMFGSGGAPLFSIARGQGDKETAGDYQNMSFFLLVSTGIVLTIIGEIFGKNILSLFGTSNGSMTYALPYLRIFLLGTVFSMISTGMNPFINAQGFSLVGMMTVIVGAVSNIILDPLFIFVFRFGIEGAAIATVISQALSAIYVICFLFGERCDAKVRLLSFREAKKQASRAVKIAGLGTAAFIMQFTNAAVQVSCNQVLSDVGGDIYISIMTIVNSARQMMETPILAFSEGASPVISFNYGAKRYDRIKQSILIMFLLNFGYTFLVWLVIRISPAMVIGIFSDDKTILDDTIPAFNIYFSTFVFMTFQHCGQVVFKSLGKKAHAIFFSLFRKIIIVVPLTYMLPYVFSRGTDGVFMAEPVSNVVGGLACFITMLFTVRNVTVQMHSKK